MKRRALLERKDQVNNVRGTGPELIRTLCCPYAAL